MISSPPPRARQRERFDNVIAGVCLATLVVGVAFALQAAWSWPLVGDSALMRYAVFLMHMGRTPYTQIVDINLPGSYLLEASAMRCFGWDAAGLRLYDGFLCVAFCALAYLAGGAGSPAGRGRSSVHGLCGGLLFTLIHLQDGLTEAGQRDLALAVLVLAAVVILLRGQRWPLAALFCFELVVGFSLTVKPTLLLLALLPLLIKPQRPEASRTVAARWTLALTGLAAAPCAAALWLWQAGALSAFRHMMQSTGTLHAALGRQSFWFLLLHCTAPITVLVVLWAGLLATRTLAWDPARKLLLAAALCGFVSYLEQGKGLSYQRYPLLGVGLVLLCLDISRASRMLGTARWLALGITACMVLWFTPKFAVTVRSFNHSAPFEANLEAALQARAAAGAPTVQCLDTFGGCINALYDLRKVQATGYLYDCYLFSPPSAAREEYRRGFLMSFEQARPDTVILTNQPCFDRAKNYDRLINWPEFNDALQRDYSLGREWHSDQLYRWWSRWERPIAFREYVRK